MIAERGTEAETLECAAELAGLERLRIERGEPTLEDVFLSLAK